MKKKKNDTKKFKKIKNFLEGLREEATKDITDQKELRVPLTMIMQNMKADQTKIKIYRQKIILI